MRSRWGIWLVEKWEEADIQEPVPEDYK